MTGMPQFEELFMDLFLFPFHHDIYIVDLFSVTSGRNFNESLQLTHKAPNRNCSRLYYYIFLLLSFEENKA